MNSVWRNDVGESQHQENPGSIPPSLIFVNFSKFIYFIFLTYLDNFFVINMNQRKPCVIFGIKKHKINIYL